MPQEALADRVALVVVLIGIAAAAFLSRRVRLTLWDLVHPGVIGPDDLKDTPEAPRAPESRVTVSIEEPVVSGGVILERDRPMFRGIAGSTPAFGTPSG